METVSLIDFLQELPLKFYVYCREVTLDRKSEKSLSVQIGDAVAHRDILDVRGFGFEKDTPKSKLLSAITPGEIKLFLRFYLHTLVGPEMILNSREGFGDYPSLRRFYVNAGCISWQQMQRPKNKNGKLKKGIQCAGFKSHDIYDDEFCERRTRNPRGLCPFHEKSEANTLWNHFPLPP